MNSHARLPTTRPGTLGETGSLYGRGALRIAAFFVSMTLGRALSAVGQGPFSVAGRLSFGARMMPVLLLCVASVSGCKRQYSVGDHVYVEWEGQDYPAVIIAATSPTKYKVHYDGYDNNWDEIVVRDRIKGLAEGNIRHPEPPAKVRAKALQAAQSNTYKTGDRVRVEWHGQLYMATVMSIVGQERYRIRYDGYGPEWDETVGLARIQPRAP